MDRYKWWLEKAKWTNRSRCKKRIRAIINDGNGIVSGGALGVDYIATDEALRLNPSATQIKIYSLQH